MIMPYTMTMGGEASALGPLELLHQPQPQPSQPENVLAEHGTDQVGMETLDEPTLAAALAATVEDGNRLEALWNKHMSAAISASPELATMPGMQKLARCVEQHGDILLFCCFVLHRARFETL